MPEIETTNAVFYDQEGNQDEFLTILKRNGVNTIRLRLWVNPDTEHSGFDEVNEFSQSLKSLGFKTWLSLHYSDSWADPGKQVTPRKWQAIPFAALRDSVDSYTRQVMQEMEPDYIQIGNEINTGLLHPEGHITNNHDQFIELLKTGIAAVRANSDETRIILHFAGIENSAWFFEQVQQLDYDIIGISYYPIWHGKSFEALKSGFENLSTKHGKSIVIAETAYPFTLDWNDWTTNIVGLDEQLILPELPATIDGQRDFVRQIKNLVLEVELGIGFCYWGGELIAWKGNQATDGSPWENQALFDFQNKALPVLSEFGTE